MKKFEEFRTEVFDDSGNYLLERLKIKEQEKIRLQEKDDLELKKELTSKLEIFDIKETKKN